MVAVLVLKCGYHFINEKQPDFYVETPLAFPVREKLRSCCRIRRQIDHGNRLGNIGTIALKKFFALVEILDPELGIGSSAIIILHNAVADIHRISSLYMVKES